MKSTVKGTTSSFHGGEVRKSGKEEVLCILAPHQRLCDSGSKNPGGEPTLWEPLNQQDEPVV